MIENSELTKREMAILRAVGAGRAQLLMGCEPSLTVDGRWCDQVAVWRLVSDGLICASRPAAVGQCVAARLTPTGYRAVYTAQDAA